MELLVCELQPVRWLSEPMREEQLFLRLLFEQLRETGLMPLAVWANGRRRKWILSKRHSPADVQEGAATCLSVIDLN